MTSGYFVQILVATFVVLLLTFLLMLYQNPLFEIYLSNWGLC